MGHKKIRPGRLAAGDRIGIVAPASPFDKEKYYQGLAVLESMGFATFATDDIFRKEGYLAGPDDHRASTINRFFADESIKAIVCTRGGFGSIRILHLLDYPTIQKNPKIFVGYSDVSAILSVFCTKCNMVTFHGPMVTTLGDATQKTKDALFSAFSSDKKVEITPKMGVVIKPGNASGAVSGGNLTTLCHLVGTPFAHSAKGGILFLEDRGEASYRIDRMLTQMRLAGYFDKLKGLILGSFEGCGEIDEIYTIVDNIFKDKQFPFLAGFELGHGRDNITIPLGIEATLDTERNMLSFHEAPTE